MACCSAVQEFAGGCVEYIYPEPHLQIIDSTASIHVVWSSRCLQNAVQTPLPQLLTDVDVNLPTNYQYCQRPPFDVHHVRCDGHIIDGRYPKSAEVLGIRPLGDRTVLPACILILGKD